MGDKTRAELMEEAAEARLQTQRAEKKFNDLDREAKAYDACYRALSQLTSGTSYSREASPDIAVIRRVIKSLETRFELDQTDQMVDADPMYYEPPMDPRDIIVSQLIEALRKQ